MKYYYVPIVLKYFNYGLNWKFDFENKKLMKASSNLQAQEEAAKLYELEKRKNFQYHKSNFSLFKVNDQQQKDLNTRYPKEALFLGIQQEPELYVLKDTKQWVKNPVIVVYSRG